MTKEQEKTIKILQWLQDNTFLFRTTKEDVEYATNIAIQAIKDLDKMNGIALDLASENDDLIEKLDAIRAEIDIARFIDKDTKLCKNANASGLEVAMQIIDKYRGSVDEI